MKLNLGCSHRNFGKDWIHVDFGEYAHLDYRCDVSKLPFDDNSVDLIYSSHTFEYFDREEAKEVLCEWKRVLKDNGILRLAVPNFKVLSELYLNGTIGIEDVIGPLYGRMKGGNDFIYHKTTYDFKSLKRVLEENSFRDVQLYDWRKTEHSEFDDFSQAYIPHMDKENGILTSLNVECKK